MCPLNHNKVSIGANTISENPSWRRSQSMAVAEWILLAILLAVFAVRGFLPAWRTLNTDFPNYYLAASLYRRGTPLDRVYEWTWFQRQKDHLGMQQELVGFAPHPPMCALPIVPLSVLSPLAAKRVWLVLNLGFLLFALELLRRVTQLSWRRLALVSLLCVIPLRANFLFGQYYILILLLICAAYYSACRGHRLTSGILLAAAASLKLFPVLFLILFARKRDWRSAAGLILGITALAMMSVAVFGSEVHRVYLFEVLPRALRGDLLGPYSLQWSSFTALWHRMFLFEPDLNPSPVLNSPVLYALAQAITVTTLLLSFLLATEDDNRAKSSKALEWASLVLLLLLLSSMPSSYHYCVLIFTAVVGIDALLKLGDERHALVVLFLFGTACASIPNIGKLLSTRLLVSLALYIWLLWTVVRRRDLRLGRRWLTLFVVLSAVLTISTMHSLWLRTEDFAWRLPYTSPGYRSDNPVVMGGEVVFTEMLAEGYRAVALQNGEVHQVPWPGDVLSIAGSKASLVGYFEQATQRSLIVRGSLLHSNTAAHVVGEGQQPVVSPDGNWLAFIQEQAGRSTVWLCAVDCEHPQAIVQRVPSLLEMSVTSAGDLIAAVGSVSEPSLILVRHATGTIESLTAITGPVRYPSISPDGRQLAFTRRDGGSWHLVVRVLASGEELQLTHAACNAASPSWEGSKALLYATDCGRGLGLSAIARITLPN